MANMEVILLERVENLGAMGSLVKVKPGYARNYLIPQKKALRATPDNVAHFEAQKAELEKRNAEKRADAQKVAKSLEGKTIVLIRLASEGGHLYGSVTTRDIAEAIADQLKATVGRGQVVMNTAFKSLGLAPVSVSLHPEVKVDVMVNVARSEEEAAIQAKTGKAKLAAEARAAELAEDAAAKSALLDDEALAVEQERSAEANAKADKKAAKKAAKSAKHADDAVEAAEEGETA